MKVVVIILLFLNSFANGCKFASCSAGCTATAGLGPSEVHTSDTECKEGMLAVDIFAMYHSCEKLMDPLASITPEVCSLHDNYNGAATAICHKQGTCIATYSKAVKTQVCDCGPCDPGYTFSDTCIDPTNCSPSKDGKGYCLSPCLPNPCTGVDNNCVVHQQFCKTPCPQYICDTCIPPECETLQVNECPAGRTCEQRTSCGKTITCLDDPCGQGWSEVSTCSNTDTASGACRGVGSNVQQLCLINTNPCADITVCGDDSCKVAPTECAAPPCQHLCMKGGCDERPSCSAGDNRIRGPCPADTACYDRTVCGRTIRCVGSGTACCLDRPSCRAGETAGKPCTQHESINNQCRTETLCCSTAYCRSSSGKTFPMWAIVVITMGVFLVISLAIVVFMLTRKSPPPEVKQEAFSEISVPTAFVEEENKEEGAVEKPIPSVTMV
eukprot:TRINITY_DN2186_c1_g3_i2.p1 TRINITY_DN2186_c1_g3~~TRINITY_DN2186_c1_g3_i2.p1  ORF type:complete len:457 (+),score=110.49 TRINITY_DN2186_c1_g3_i2:54-1373(+)